MKDQAKCDLRQVVLLRHGESVWNKDNLFTGWTADPRLPQTTGTHPGVSARANRLTAGVDQMTEAEYAVPEAAAHIPPEVHERLATAEQLNDEDREAIIQIASNSLARFQPKEGSKSGPEPVQNTTEPPIFESETEPKTGFKHEAWSD